MKVGITIWKIMENLGYHLPWVLIGAIFILVENHLIKMKSRGRIIFPVVVLILTVIFWMIQFGRVSFSEPESLMTQIEYDATSGMQSHITILYAEKDGVLAIGQLITEEGVDSKFINLTVENGKIISTSEPVDLIDRIESDVRQFEDGFSGKSMPYGKLLEMEKEYKSQQPDQIDFITFFYRVIYSVILIVISSIVLRMNNINKGGADQT